MQDYRRLRVWTMAHAHILNIRRETHRFPRTGYASLKSQMIRAADSIAFNIIEGCAGCPVNGRTTHDDEPVGADFPSTG